MNKLMTMLTVLAFCWMPLMASAADSAAPANGAAPAADAAKNQADLEKQLDDARVKLQEDAHKVADLSMQLNGSSYYYISSSDGGPGKHGFLGVDLDGVDRKSVV